MPTITVVVPTYREVDNLPHLIDELAQVRREHRLDIDVLIMDDDSRDGSAELIAARPETWVQMVVRTADRGLSAAVLDGLRRARSEIVICMDADLSHPASAIPQMVRKLEAGADFVVGSRYVEGGTTSHRGFLRWLKSRIAIGLARPLTGVSDPMAGFFALRRTTLDDGAIFNPVGYKIGLELIVKCRCERVVEVPIHFEERRFGEGKLTVKQQLLHIQHLRRLYMFKHGMWTELAQFLTVGAMGTLVNLSCLTGLLAAGLGAPVAVGGAIVTAMCFNFVLNRRFSFAVVSTAPWRKQFVGFVAASSVGSTVNYAMTVWLLARWPTLPAQAAALAGIASGTLFNFLTSRYLVFRTAHIRSRSTR